MASDLQWAGVSQTNPCTICGKNDWCRFTVDGEIADCNREQGVGGVQKQDKSGQIFWRHFAKTSPGADGRGSQRKFVDLDVEAPARNHKKRGEPELIQQVYSVLIDELCVYDEHVQHLMEVRKLQPDEVQRIGYRSFPSTHLERQRLVDALVEQFGDDKLTSVPGFDRPKRDSILLEDGTLLDPTEVRLCGTDGYLLPQRDADGHIQSLVLRRDPPVQSEGAGRETAVDAGYSEYMAAVRKTAKPSRYLPFTAYDNTGAAAAIGVHVPLHAPEQRKRVRVIEGIIKADIATMRTGVLSLGMQNGGRWKLAAKLAEDLGAETLVLTPDADTRSNRGICTSLVLACNALAAQGTALVLETWDPKFGKGLDDVINNGHADKVQVHEGWAIWTVLKEWLASCGADRDRYVEARVVLDEIFEKMQADKHYVFKPNIAEALAVLDPATVEAQRILGPLKTALQRSGRRDLETRMKKFRAKVDKADDNKRKSELVAAGQKVFVRGDEAELSLALLDDLTPTPSSGGFKVNHELAVFDGGQLHLYNVDTGVYEHVPDAKLHAHVANYAGSPVAGQGVLRVSNGFAKGSVKLAQARRNTPNFFNDAPLGVMFANGFLLVDPIARTAKLVSHSPRHRGRSRYGFDYRAGAKPTRLLNAMSRWFENKPEQQLYIDCVQEYLGACIVGLAPTFAKILLLTGAGNDGKSTFVKILIGVMPDRSVSNVAPQSFDREYNRAQLEGKLLNAVFDLPENDLLDSGPLKAITVGDPIEARHPYGAVFTLKSRAGQLYNCNTLFKTRDTTPAFRRRWIIFEFDNPIGTKAGEQPNEHLAEEILGQESAAIVSWAIDGVVRRLQSSKYTIPSASETVVADWLGENDTVAQFVASRLSVFTDEQRADKKSGMKSDDIYPEYKTWCRDDGHGNPMTKARFVKKLKAHLKLTDKDVHANDGNYYPVALRAATDLQAKIREAQKDDAETDQWVRSFDLQNTTVTVQVSTGRVLGTDIEDGADDDDDDAVRQSAWRTVHGRCDEDDEVPMN